MNLALEGVFKISPLYSGSDSLRVKETECKNRWEETMYYLPYSVALEEKEIVNLEGSIIDACQKCGKQELASRYTVNQKANITVSHSPSVNLGLCYYRIPADIPRRAYQETMIENGRVGCCAFVYRVEYCNHSEKWYLGSRVAAR